jgi:hypothetical protein
VLLNDELAEAILERQLVAILGEMGVLGALRISRVLRC